MKILITGITGFVGSNLQPYLKKNEHNRVEGLNLRQNWPEQITGDVSVIIHLAGKAHDLKRASNPEAYYQVNFELTKQLYDAFLLSEAQKFIFVSSVKAAADAVEGILTEDKQPNPQTDYGKSKLLAEQYIQSRPLPAGKSYFILRPCMIHGPGNKGNLNLLYNFVKKGLPYPLAAFHNKRSFLSIENLCFVINELINRGDIAAGIYQVADDDTLSTNELIKTICSAAAKSPRLWHIPGGIIKTLAKLGDVLKLPLNTERLNKLTESYIVNNAKIKVALKKELPVKAREGVISTIKSFQ